LSTQLETLQTVASPHAMRCMSFISSSLWDKCWRDTGGIEQLKARRNCRDNVLGLVIDVDDRTGARHSVYQAVMKRRLQYSCKIINHERLRSTLIFLKHNDNLVIKAHPVLPSSIILFWDVMLVHRIACVTLHSI
jgi:hypothetical protein